VDAKGTVYFATQQDGVFASPNNLGTNSNASVAASLYTISTQGSRLLALDSQGNAYVANYGTAINPTGDAVARITLDNLTAPASKVGVGVTNSATLSPVSTIFNDGSCSTAPGLIFTVAEGGTATTEFGAVAATNCNSTLTGASSYATTITFKPTATGSRSATITAKDSKADTGAATVTGIGQ
jgi:hypothetical protein